MPPTLAALPIFASSSTGHLKPAAPVPRIQRNQGSHSSFLLAERASPSDLLCLQIANSGGIFRGCSENRKRRLLAFNQNCFAERAPTGQPQSRRAHSCAVNSRYGIRNTARKKYRVILGSAFCSDFETRLPPSRMHSSLTAIHQSSWVRSQMFCCCSEY